jgi:NTP pyrophosphatase (non-canonical NTP hydrolase)
MSVFDTPLLPEDNSKLDEIFRGWLHAIIIECHQTAKDSGFWDVDGLDDPLGRVLDPEDEIGVQLALAKLALIGTEVAEAAEEIRKGSERVEVGEELADIVIRVFDLAGAKGIPLFHYVLAKMEKNKGRGRRHGGKLA